MQSACRHRRGDLWRVDLDAGLHTACRGAWCDPDLVLQSDRHADAAERRQGRAGRSRTRHRGVHPAHVAGTAAGVPEGKISRAPEAVRAWAWIETKPDGSTCRSRRPTAQSRRQKRGGHDQSDRVADRGAHSLRRRATASATSVPMSGCRVARISPSIRTPRPRRASSISTMRRATTAAWCASPPTS